MVQQNTYLVATIKPWNLNNYAKLVKDCGDYWALVTSPVTLDANVNALCPKYIFLPHWSWIIPKAIYDKYECVAFHMTDLPYGRGAEPLQHLIARGLTETMVSAFRVSEGIDTGPIYMKRPMSLYGSAEEIYIRCSNICFQIIREIVTMNPDSVPQIGVPVNFEKRTLEDCRLVGDTLQQTYDLIRGQDAETYPKAFLEYGNLRLEFSRAGLKYDGIVADVRITRRGE